MKTITLWSIPMEEAKKVVISLCDNAKCLIDDGKLDEALEMLRQAIRISNDIVEEVTEKEN